MKPPFIARTLLRFLPARHREFIVGDLEEEYLTRRLLRDGRWSAGLWYWRQAIASLASEARAGVRHESIVELGEPRRGSMFDTLRQDLRYAFRSLNGRPVFTTVAILTLALGIGANTSIYSIANWLLLRPVPGITKPEELAIIGFGDPRMPIGLSWANLNDLRSRSNSFTSIVGSADGSLQILSENAPPLEVRSTAVGGDYFGALGVTMQRGRPIHEAETVPGQAAAIVVISDRLWTQMFARDPAVIGRTLRANQQVLTIVGVAPKGFRGTERLGELDAWVPFSMQADLRHMPQEFYYDRGSGFRFFEVIGRIKPGLTASAAEADLQRAMTSLVADYPKENENYKDRPMHVYAGIGVSVLIKDRTELIVKVMLGIVAMLLVISSANVANMLLVRATAKRAEAAMRRALGASTARLALQQLVESLVLALLGGVCALFVAGVFLKLIEGGRITGLPPIKDVPIDGHVLAFTLGVCLLTGLLFALTPLGVLRRLDLAPDLQRSSNRQTAKGSLLRHSIAVVQIALSLVLLVGALMLGRTLSSLARIDLGFEPAGLAGISISPEPQGYPREQIPQLGAQVLAEVRQSAGIESAALAHALPFGCCNVGWPVKDPLQRNDDRIRMDVEFVSDGFFPTVGIPILRGRGIEARDWIGASKTEFNIVLSETAARRLFDDREPLGQTIVTATRDPYTLHVVGIARDARLGDLTQPMPDMMYWPAHMLELYSFSVIVRGRGDASTLESELRRALAAVNPSIPPRFAVVTENVKRYTAEQRLLGLLFGLFSTLAVLLAAIGLYGVLGSSVSERRREFGLRMALGAQSRRVFGMVALQSSRLVVLGLVMGLLLAYWLSRYLEAQLFGVDRLDPASFVGATLLFIVIAAIATAIPTRAATRVDPAVTLRE